MLLIGQIEEVYTLLKEFTNSISFDHFWCLIKNTSLIPNTTLLFNILADDLSQTLDIMVHVLDQCVYLIINSSSFRGLESTPYENLLPRIQIFILGPFNPCYVFTSYCIKLRNQTFDFIFCGKRNIGSVKNYES